MIIGMDFGTTNTGAARFDGSSIQLLPLDPANQPASICRTSIYITRSKDYHLGSPALKLYFNQNVGRPTRYRKVWVGEIQQVFAELPTFYRDVFVYEDEFSPGRLFLSIKTALRNPSYNGTVFQGNWYSATDLVSIFLSGMKLRMQAHLGRPVDEIVLGRPVRFSDNPDEDKVAQSRLLEAAFQAGFSRVYLELEPVAAALSYERTIRERQTVLVFDFGGGTLDFTIMELGDPKRRRVLATAGIPVAGDVFDQRLFRVSIPKHLGEGDYFKSGDSLYPIPSHIFDLLTTPQEVVSLNTPQNQEMLRSIHLGALHKEKTRALQRIVSSNYALYLFELVERAKRQLSERTETVLNLQGEDFSIEETIGRLRFEQAIRAEYEAVRQGLENLLSAAGLAPRDIHRVIRTGGSSQIPLFTRLLHRTFGYDRVEEIDVFSSVTSGLAIRGYEIEQGLAALPAYDASLATASEVLAGQQEKDREVERIDLDSVRQRLEVSRQYREGRGNLPEAVLILLMQHNVRLLPAGDLEAGITLEGVELQGLRAAVYAGMDANLLFATDAFKLVSVPAQSLWIAQQAAEQGVRDLLLLDPEENVTAAALWNPRRLAHRYLALVTRSGQARAFEGRLLAEHLEKVPYFQLDRRYSGLPASLVPLAEGEELLVGTGSGRVGRAPLREIAIQVYDVLKSRPKEQVTAAAPLLGEGPVLALSTAGTFLPCIPAAIPTGGPPAGRGHTLRRNFPIVAFISDIGPCLLSSHGRVHCLPSAADLSRRAETHPGTAPSLGRSETLLALIQR